MVESYGAQNAFFNGNPQATHFYKVIQKTSHFGQESISIGLDGPNQMMMDAPIQLRAKIPRHADLLTDLTLVFDIPDIYSKLSIYISTIPNPDITTRIPSFRWIHMLGAFIIDNVSISINGAQIQSFPGEWLAVRASVDYDSERYAKWCALVGETPELTAPEWGLKGNAPGYPYQPGGYPHAVADPSAPATPIAPSIDGRQIRVPLPFWFSESWGTALPLISLQRSEVEVVLQLKTLREIYRLMDDYFQSEPTRPGRRLKYDPSRPTQIDPLLIPSGIPNPPYTNLTLQTNYHSFADFAGDLKHFFVDPTTASTPRQNGFIMNAHLEGTYIFLTVNEQRGFATRELEHVVHQVTQFTFPAIVSQTRLDMNIFGLLTRLVFFGRRTDAIGSRNDYINLSNWKSLSQAPYWPLGGSNPPTPNSGRLIQFSQRDILRSARLLLDGNEYHEEKPAIFFEVQSSFASGGGSNTRLKDSVMGPLYRMNFALNPSDHVGPSGALNASIIRNLQLEVTPWELDPFSPFAYDFTVYTETMNTVKFQSGMGGLAFAT
jgi:hypothetical protein